MKTVVVVQSQTKGSGKDWYFEDVYSSMDTLMRADPSIEWEQVSATRWRQQQGDIRFKADVVEVLTRPKKKPIHRNSSLAAAFSDS